MNVSARQVREPGFAQEVLDMLRATDVSPDLLIIELTEHALIDLRLAYPSLVETVAERDALIDIGAVKGRGFLYHRPMGLAAAHDLLETGGVSAVPAGG